MLRGTCNGWAGDADAFTYQGNGVYTLTKTFNGEFKVVRDGSTWMSKQWYHTFNYVFDNVTLTTVVGSPAITTGVIEIAGGARVQSVKYVSLSGQMSDRPFTGVNVVVTTYSDGTVRTVKAMR